MIFASDIYADFFDNTWVRIVLVIIAVLIVQRLSHAIIERVVNRAMHSRHYDSKAEAQKRADTLTRVFNDIVTVALWIVAGLIILDRLGVNLAALATGAGLIGVIFGFGAQQTVRDFLAGVMIIFENQYRVGDVVSLAGGTSGIVEDITILITKLRDLDGSLHIVRNGDAGVVTNMTSSWSRALIDIEVGWDADLNKVERIINEVGAEMAKDKDWKDVITEPIQFYRVDGFTDSSVMVKALGQTTPIDQWSVAGEFRRRIKLAFEKNGIERPYQRRVITEAPRETKREKQ